MHLSNKEIFSKGPRVAANIIINQIKQTNILDLYGNLNIYDSIMIPS